MGAVGEQTSSPPSPPLPSKKLTGGRGGDGRLCGGNPTLGHWAALALSGDGRGQCSQPSPVMFYIELLLVEKGGYGWETGSGDSSGRAWQGRATTEELQGSTEGAGTQNVFGGSSNIEYRAGCGIRGLVLERQGYPLLVIQTL
jgi:hypothetical protein